MDQVMNELRGYRNPYMNGAWSMWYLKHNTHALPPAVFHQNSIGRESFDI
ncbi:hypothetical protein EDO6_04716 [Paenibacillus xylanexedens]|nr:hypothetical protein EDO6_04716 [Paenibacillus xylanexedens]